MRISSWISLAVGVFLAGCGGTTNLGTKTPLDISGNWLFSDTSIQNGSKNYSGIAAAVVASNGTLSGNVTFLLPDVGSGAGCSSFGVNLPLSGTVDSAGNIQIAAIDGLGLVTFYLNGTVTPDGKSLSNGSYHITGSELTSAAAAQLLPSSLFSDISPTCTSYIGNADGLSLASVTATYSGSVKTLVGTTTQMSINVTQGSSPVASSSELSTLSSTTGQIPGELSVSLGGFPVTGTISLTSSRCGLVSGAIAANTSFIAGNLLDLVFTSSSTQTNGTDLVGLIDPATGSITVLTGGEMKSPCSTLYLSGALART